MNYKRHYDLLINRARVRIASGYVERHHILPRCMNGSDDPNNLVDLTAEEHYLAHLLLHKIHPDIPGLLFAAHRMSSTKRTHGRKCNNKLYGWLRRKHAKVLSEAFTGRSHPCARRTPGNAKAIVLDGKSYPSISHAARDLGLDRQVISRWAKTGIAPSNEGRVKTSYRETKIVVVNGITYPSTVEAARCLFLHEETVRKWARKGSNGAYYLG